MKQEVLKNADENYNQGNVEIALNLYFDYLFSNEPTSYLYMKIAHCNKTLNDFENAGEYYEKSLELDESNYESLYYYADCLMLTGRYDEAAEKIGILTTLPNNYFYELAIEKKSEILSRKHNNLGGIYIKENKLDEAEEEFLKAIELYPKDKRNYTNLGVVYIRRNNPQKAIEWMKKAVEIDENYIRGYYNLGTILLKNGYYKQSVDIFNKALEIDPENDDCSDIRKNMNVAVENLNTSTEDFKNQLSESTIQISNEYILELSNNVLPENVDSIDFLFTKNNKRYVLAYCGTKNYKIYIENDILKTELMQ